MEPCLPVVERPLNGVEPSSRSVDQWLKHFARFFKDVERRFSGMEGPFNDPERALKGRKSCGRSPEHGAEGAGGVDRFQT